MTQEPESLKRYPEIQSMWKIYQELQKFDEEGKQRMLKWVSDRVNYDRVKAREQNERKT